jgi:hypothetical protein
LSRKRQKIDSLAAMAAANPVSTTVLAAEIGEAELERALARAVTFGREPSQPDTAFASDAKGGSRPHGDTKNGSPHVGLRVALGRRGRRRATLGFGVGIAVVAAIAALLVIGGWLSGSGSGRPEFAAAAIRVAEANPRLLISEPGWKIVRADEFEPDSGELTFSDGSRNFEIHWYPARLYRQYLRDRADVSRPEVGVLLGHRAATVEYSPEEYATTLSPQGKVFIEVRGRLGSKRAYDELLHSLRPVDVETWLDAMPPTTVRPEARAKAVEQMLRGIPLPPGFDATALQGEDSIADHSSLAVKVGNAVACGWAESWIAARASGDQAAARRAVDAMAGSAAWPIVRETKVPWFTNYKVVTGEMRAGHLNRKPASYEVRADGRIFAFGPAWRLALGCDGTYRREVDSVPGEGPNPGQPSGR